MNRFEALSYAVSMYIPFSALIHVFLALVRILSPLRRLSLGLLVQDC